MAKFDLEIWVGRATAIVGLITTPWALAMSAIAGFSVWASSWATDFVLTPAFEAGIGTFLAFLWTLIGLRQLRSYREPKLVKTHQEFEYGLTWEGCTPIFSVENPDAALQFSLAFRNFSSGPLRVTLEKFDIVIGTRTLPPNKKIVISNFFPRGAGRIMRNAAFSKDDIQEFMNKRVVAIADFIATYGQPNKPAVRQLRMKLELHIEMRESPPFICFLDNILEEYDEPVSIRG